MWCVHTIFVWVGFQPQVLQALPWNLRTGFFKLVQKVLRVAEGGLLHGGPPCSSFVWMNSGTSCRSKDMPEGRKNVKSVQIANANLGGNQTENVFAFWLFFPHFQNYITWYYISNLISDKIWLKQIIHTIPYMPTYFPIAVDIRGYSFVTSQRCQGSWADSAFW